MSKFKHDLVDIDENGDIVVIGSKEIYNTDGLKTLKDWLKESEPKVAKTDFPNMKSALNVVENGKQFLEGSIGTLFYHSNDVYQSTQNVWLCSGVASSVQNVSFHRSILPSNFLRITTAFSARKLIEATWINIKDNFLAPDETNPNFNQFAYDSVIYSLFNTSSNQSSLRNVNYKNKMWQIPNHFFFMSKEEIKNLANENNNDECYEDVTNESEERFVYKFIEENKDKFSKEALDVLEFAKDLVRKSFKYRKVFNDDNQNYQINNWDAGWYQIKGVLKVYMKDELKAFREVYKKLSEKLRPMVYELGMMVK